MFEKKYRYQLTADEYAVIINSLIKPRRYTDAVDDLLIKLLNYKKLKSNNYNKKTLHNQLLLYIRSNFCYLTAFKISLL